MQRLNADPDSLRGSHVIVGNDSDIILMTLMSPVKQLYILSQTSKGRASIFHCISLDAVHQLWSSSFGNAGGNQV